MTRTMEPGAWWGELPFEIANCMEWTAALIRTGRLKFDERQDLQAVTCHDRCSFAKSCEIVEAPTPPCAGKARRT
jgi:hypothetical protein